MGSIRESKLIVAAINGVAVGVGITMVLPADVIIASDQARIGVQFCLEDLVNSRKIWQRKRNPHEINHGAKTKTLKRGEFPLGLFFLVRWTGRFDRPVKTGQTQQYTYQKINRTGIVKPLGKRSGNALDTERNNDAGQQVSSRVPG